MHVADWIALGSLLVSILGVLGALWAWLWPRPTPQPPAMTVVVEVCAPWSCVRAGADNVGRPRNRAEAATLVRVSSGNPFESSGYARIDATGRLRPVSKTDAERERGTSYLPDRDHDPDPDRCFLCATALTRANRSDEHVFPQWRLGDLDLWQERLTLLNGTQIPYASLRIGACKPCNNVWLSAVEQQVATAFRQGPQAVAALDQTTLALWLAKIYYGLHFKETGLAADRKARDGSTIQTAEHLRRNLGDLHHIMQALRGRARFTRAVGSIIVLETQVPDEPRLRFEYRDLRDTAFIALRIGSTAVLASLRDWGAVSDGIVVPEIEVARQLQLHPYQFEEVAAAVGYAASKFQGEFVYSVQPQSGHDLIDPVLVRDAGRPVELLAPTAVGELAALQAAFMGMAVEDIYDPQLEQLWTCLRDEDDQPAPLLLAKVPFGAELITPLRARRDAT